MEIAYRLTSDPKEARKFVGFDDLYRLAELLPRSQIMLRTRRMIPPHLGGAYTIRVTNPDGTFAGYVA